MNIYITINDGTKDYDELIIDENTDIRGLRQKELLKKLIPSGFAKTSMIKNEELIRIITEIDELISINKNNNFSEQITILKSIKKLAKKAYKHNYVLLGNTD